MMAVIEVERSTARWSPADVPKNAQGYRFVTVVLSRADQCGGHIHHHLYFGFGYPVHSSPGLMFGYWAMLFSYPKMNGRTI